MWEIGPVPADQYVSLKVNFPPGSLVGAPPQWYAKKQAVLTAAKSALPWAAGIGLGLTGVTSLLLIRALRRNRGEEIQKIPLGIINRPPGEQPPMLVSALMTYGRSIFPSTIGGLLSLCQRGWLEIRETGKKGLFGGRDFVFVQTRADVLELMEHERSLLQILFEDRQGRRDEVPITRLGMDLLTKGEWLLENADEFHLPLLLMQGTDDHLVSVEATRTFSERVPQDNITYKEWTGFYHELHNEPEKLIVFDYVHEWIGMSLKG